MNIGMQISDIRRPAPALTTKAYSSSEIGYCAAYRHYLVVSEKLRDAQCCREAYSALLFAIECFLKDVFCLCRFHIVGDINNVPHAPLLKALMAASFSHNIADVSLMLQRLVPALRADTKYMIFHALLPKTTAWNEERYNDPASERTDYAQKYSELVAALSDVTNNVLGGIN